MNSRHLTTGNPCPPLKNGKLRVYSMRFCPYAQRVLLVLAAKGIPYDVVNINLEKKPEFIFQKSPQGKVPVIEFIDGQCLQESLIISDYIDETFPDRNAIGDSSFILLNSADPLTKARDRILVQNFDKAIALYYKASFFLPRETANEEVSQVISDLYETLGQFEKELESRETIYFGGNTTPGMVDYAIWPWFERFPVLELQWKDSVDFGVVKTPLPNLARWERDMKADNAVQQSYCTPDMHFRYRMSKNTGTTNYDILLNEV